MTKNQENQIVSLLNKCINGIEELRDGLKRLEDDVKTLKADVEILKADVGILKSDSINLKEGQSRIEKEMRLNNRVINEVVGQQLRMDVRIHELETASV